MLIIGSIGGAEKLLLAKVKNAFGRIGIFQLKDCLLAELQAINWHNVQRLQIFAFLHDNYEYP